MMVHPLLPAPSDAPPSDDDLGTVPDYTQLKKQSCSRALATSSGGRAERAAGAAPLRHLRLQDCCRLPCAPCAIKISKSPRRGTPDVGAAR
nr:host cell factor 1-like [Chelonoidis abingdonii]